MIYNAQKKKKREQSTKVKNTFENIYNQETTTNNSVKYNIENNSMYDISEKKTNENETIITQAIGNIPINKKVLNRYSTVREIFDNETYNFDGNVKVKNNISELNNLDFKNLTSKETKVFAKNIFEKYNILELLF